MKKFVLAAVAAAAAASFSGSALAVNLNSPLPIPDVYATELVVAGVTQLRGTKVVTDLGFGVSAGQTRFIRYDFTNATIGIGGINAADLSVDGIAAGNIIVSAGGAAGGTNVIFQITAPPATSIAQGAEVTLNLFNVVGPVGPVTGGLVPNPKNPIDARYRLYETAAAAVAGSPRLAEDSGTIIVFGSGVALAATSPNTTTVDVASTPVTYSKFLPAGLTTETLTRIGTVTLGTGSAMTPAGDPVQLGDFLGAGAAITLTGTDLLPAIIPDGLTLQLGLTCGATGGIDANPRTPTTAAFLLPTPLPAPGGSIVGSLCFRVAANNPLPIAAQVFSADVFPGVAPGPGVAPDPAAVTAGTFVRNGLVLKAAFAETNTTNANGYGTAVHLNNNSGSPAPYTVNCVLPVGSVAGTPGTVPALSGRRLSLSRGLGCPSDGTLRGVEIVFGTTPGSVIGSIVRQNLTTGQASFDGMVGNQ